MRWLGWLSKLLISALLISCLSVFTTAYIVDLYVDRLLDQWGVGEIIRPSIDADDYVSKLVNPSQLWSTDDSTSAPSVIEGGSTPNEGNMTKEEDTLNEGTEDLNQGSDDPGFPVFNQGQGSELEQEGAQLQPTNDEFIMPGNEVSNEEGNPSSNPSNNPPSEQSSLDQLKDSLVMSAQEFNEKRKGLTTEDKTAIFTIVITKLPQEELQRMSLLLEDGITTEELNDFEDVINAYLEQEEVDKLLAILNKY